MTDKRFIESATQNVDDGKINHYIYDMRNRKYLKMSDEKTTKNLCDLLNELHEENQSYKLNVSKTLQKHYNRLVELSNNGGEDECGFMVFIKFLSQELDVELEDLE